MQQVVVHVKPLGGRDSFSLSSFLFVPDCGKLPEAWGVSDVSAITDLNKTTPATALKAYGNLVEAIYNTTVGWVCKHCLARRFVSFRFAC